MTCTLYITFQILKNSREKNANFCFYEISFENDKKNTFSSSWVFPWKSLVEKFGGEFILDLPETEDQN